MIFESEEDVLCLEDKDVLFQIIHSREQNHSNKSWRETI